MNNDLAICLAQLNSARLEAKRLNVRVPKRLTAIRCDMYRTGSGWFLVESRDGGYFSKSVVAFNAYEAKAKAILSIIDNKPKS